MMMVQVWFRSPCKLYSSLHQTWAKPSVGPGPGNRINCPHFNNSRYLKTKLASINYGSEHVSHSHNITCWRLLYESRWATTNMVWFWSVTESGCLSLRSTVEVNESHDQWHNQCHYGQDHFQDVLFVVHVFLLPLPALLAWFLDLALQLPHCGDVFLLAFFCWYCVKSRSAVTHSLQLQLDTSENTSFQFCNQFVACWRSWPTLWTKNLKHKSFKNTLKSRL